MLEFFIFLSAVLDFIILFCFFLLCKRVGLIQKIFYPKLNYQRFCLLLYLGRRDDATRMLYIAFSEDDDLVYAFHTNNGRDQARANLKAKYQKYFDALELELDFDKIGDMVKK